MPARAILHSGYLAIVAALLAATALVVNDSRWQQALAAARRHRRRTGAAQWPTGRSSLVCCFTFGLFAIIAWRRYWYLMRCWRPSPGAVALILIWYSAYVPMAQNPGQWGLGPVMSRFSERAILTYQGMAIADQHFRSVRAWHLWRARRTEVRPAPLP